MAQLEGWLNFDHAEQVGTLQWLNSLVNHIPQLAQYKGAVAKLDHDTSVTLPPPHDHQTRIHSRHRKMKPVYLNFATVSPTLLVSLDKQRTVTHGG